MGALSLELYFVKRENCPCPLQVSLNEMKWLQSRPSHSDNVGHES